MSRVLGRALVGIVQSRFAENKEVALPRLFHIFGMEETLDVGHSLVCAQEVLKKMKMIFFGSLTMSEITFSKIANNNVQNSWRFLALPRNVYNQLVFRYWLRLKTQK